jgi:hypothetical protein
LPVKIEKEKLLAKLDKSKPIDVFKAFAGD